MSGVGGKKDVKRVPELRFSEFRGEWGAETLLGLSKNGFSNGVFNDPKKVGAGYKLINVKDMYLGDQINLDNLTLLKISKNEFEKNKALLGDVFFTRSSLVKEGIAYSNVFLSDDHTTTYDGHLIRMSPDIEQIFPVFLGYALKTNSSRRQLVARGKTTTMTTIGQEDISTVEMTFCSMEEQQKIASFLTAVDSKITQLGKKKALLAQYKKGMMQKLFSQDLRFPSTSSGQATVDLKDSPPPGAELVEAPYPDWKEKKLGEIAVFSKGKGISKADVSENGALQCIRYGQLYTDYAETISEVKSRTDIPANELVLSEANDIIIPASGETQIDIATASCVLIGGVALGGDLNIIKTKYDGVFLSYYLNSKRKYDIARLSQGISVVHLYAAQLKLLKIHIPSIPEQQKIANFLSAIDQKINLVATELNQAKNFKKGLLQKMFI